jgi:hypothetical protein
VIAAANLGELLDAEALLAAQPVPAGGRLGVVANTRVGAAPTQPSRPASYRGHIPCRRSAAPPGNPETRGNSCDEEFGGYAPTSLETIVRQPSTGQHSSHYQGLVGGIRCTADHTIQHGWTINIHAC